jgi:hypothetical protein
VFAQTLPKRSLYGNVVLSQTPRDFVSGSYTGLYCRNPVAGPVSWVAIWHDLVLSRESVALEDAIRNNAQVIEEKTREILEQLPRR